MQFSGEVQKVSQKVSSAVEPELSVTPIGMM